MNEHSTISPASVINFATSPDAADIFDAVGFGEAEVAVETVAHIVAVEQHGVMTGMACSRCSTMLAMVDLPAPDSPVNQTIAGVWCFSAARSALPISSGCQWMIGSPPQAEIDHAGADSMVGEPVDDDEGAGPAVLAIGIERDRHVGREIAEADVVEAERVAARCSRVLTSILYLMAVTVTGVVLVPILAR